MEESRKELDEALENAELFFIEEEQIEQKRLDEIKSEFKEFADTLDLNTLRNVFLAEILNQNCILSPFEILPKLDKDVRKPLENEFREIMSKVNGIIWSKLIKHTTVTMLEDVVGETLGEELDASFIEGMKLNPSSPKDYLDKARISIGGFIGEEVDQ